MCLAVFGEFWFLQAVVSRLRPSLSASAGATAGSTVDISDAVEAMEALHISTDVCERVCDAMVVDGDVTGAMFLRLVVDEGVKMTVATKLRQRLRIAAPVPPPTAAVCADHGCRGSGHASVMSCWRVSTLQAPSIPSIAGGSSPEDSPPQSAVAQPGVSITFLRMCSSCFG
jgi:hypothetical protein